MTHDGGPRPAPVGDLPAAIPEVDRRRLRRSLLLAHGSGAVVLGGVQGIVPALPEMQRVLELTDAQVGLVNSVYLFPSVILAIPAGFLMDRIGRRRVFVGSLVLFGVTGLALLLVTTFPALLALRALQGVAFAAVLPLSVTLVGDLLSGMAQVREQGVRMLFLTGADVALALLGGALVAISWQAPFVLHALALPLAAAGWRNLRVPVSRPHPQDRLRVPHLVALLRTRLAVALQSLGLLRFFFKFALLAYSPVLLSDRGWSTAAIAVGLAGTAAAATLSAYASRWVNARWRGTAVLSASLAVTAISFSVLALTHSDILMAVCLIALGAAEGSLGVIANAMILEGVTPEQRAVFVSTAAAFKNLGKFAAPALLGAALLTMSLSSAFLLVAGVAAATTAMVPSLRPLDVRLAVTSDDDLRRPSAAEG